MTARTTKKKILLFQTRSRAESAERERGNYRSALGNSANLDCVWSLDEKLARKNPDEILAGYRGVIFGGSSDYDFDGGRMRDDPFRLVAMILLSRTRNLIDYALREEIPVLGVCFGHQLIANMHGGEVQYDPAQKKGGTHEVRLTAAGKKDPLFREMPPSFLAHYVHKDSVTKLPQGAVLLAKSENCRFSALRYGKNAYTMQFHPEKTTPRVIENLTDTPELAEGQDPATMVREAPEVATLLRSWVKKIVSRR